MRITIDLSDEKRPLRPELCLALGMAVGTILREAGQATFTSLPVRRELGLLAKELFAAGHAAVNPGEEQP